MNIDYFTLLDSSQLELKKICLFSNKTWPSLAHHMSSYDQLGKVSQ
jgi:hypothetical protein